MSGRELPFEVPVFGVRDEIALEQLIRCLQTEDAVGGALMADHHVGYSQPIGGVAAYRHSLSVSGAGYDLGCGVKGVRTNLRAGDVPVGKVMDEISRRISFGLGRPNAEPVEHDVLDRIRSASFAPQRELAHKAAEQLGTVGSGNHYVILVEEVEGDDPGALWVAAHFGSRGFGHITASGFMALARGLAFDERVREGEMHSPPILLDDRTDLGQAYIAASQLAFDYAHAGRDVVVDRVLGILGAQATWTVHNHHNAIFRETVAGEPAWVARKGATPAFPGDLGFVGGSMGDISAVVEGIDSPQAALALHSTVHGAGRVMSRTKAAGGWRKRWICPVHGCETVLGDARGGKAKGRCKRHPQIPLRRVRVRAGGEIDWDDVRRRLRRQGIELRGGGADEAPGVYKKLKHVLAAHEGQVAVRAILRPRGVAMAGADVHDPFKD